MTIPKLFKKASGKLWSNGNKLKKYSDDCCSECEDCASSQAPPAWKVVFAGIADLATPPPPFYIECLKCNDYNKSFIVPKSGGWGDCHWMFVHDPAGSFGCYGAYTVQVSVYEVVGEYFIQATLDGLTPVSETLIFRKTYGGSPPDCNNQNNVLLSLYGTPNFSRCDTSAATCRITSCP